MADRALVVGTGYFSERMAEILRRYGAEVPVTFLNDREGRLSHHKRSGWFSPWQAAWINLRAMFVYGADNTARWYSASSLAPSWRSGLASASLRLLPPA